MRGQSNGQKGNRNTAARNPLGSAMCLRESDYELTRGLAGEQIMYNGGTSIAEEQQSTELKIQITINFAATLRLSNKVPNNLLSCINSFSRAMNWVEYNLQNLTLSAKKFMETVIFKLSPPSLNK